MNMICSNCGKSIPILGNVCPYCNADKSKDRQKHSRTMSFVGAAFFGAIGGAFIGNMVNAPGGGLCFGAFIGIALGLVVCFFFLRNPPQKP